MIRGLYSATSGMIANQRKQEALSNNLANINTPGYKNDDAMYRSFPQMLIERIHDPSPPIENLPQMPKNPPLVGKLSNGVYIQEYIPNFKQGDMMETGKVLDIALADDLAKVNINGRSIQPRTFFLTQTKNGDIRYTRNGNFTVDAMGRLTTGTGDFVLDANKEKINIHELLVDSNGNPLPMNRENIRVTPYGTIQTPSNEIQIGLAQIDNPTSLEKDGNGRYRWNEEGIPPMYTINENSPVQIKQGYLERSNVDASQTMVAMMETVRQFEANQKVLQAYEQTLTKLNEIGRLG